MIHILDSEQDLDSCFLLFHFLTVYAKEIKNLLSGADPEQSDDFDQLTALKKVVFISLRSKTQSLVKYEFQLLYLQPDLTPLLRHLSQSLSLLKIVDKSLSFEVWEQVFASTVSCYTFYYVLSNKDSFVGYSVNPVSRTIVDTYERETTRLAEFFKGFVRTKAEESMLLQVKMLVQYFKTDDCEAAVGYLKSLISMRCIKSKQLLVIFIHRACYHGNSKTNFQEYLAVS